MTATGNRLDNATILGMIAMGVAVLVVAKCPTPDDSLRRRIEVVIGGVGALYLRVLLGRIAVGW
jgi:hypothetical protein